MLPVIMSLKRPRENGWGLFYGAPFPERMERRRRRRRSINDGPIGGNAAAVDPGFERRGRRHLVRRPKSILALKEGCLMDG